MVSQVLTKREILRKLTTAMALSTHQYASPLTDGKRLEHLNQLRCVSFLELAGLKDGVIPSRFSGGERQWKLLYHPTDDENGCLPTEWYTTPQIQVLRVRRASPLAFQTCLSTLRRLPCRKHRCLARLLRAIAA